MLMIGISVMDNYRFPNCNSVVRVRDRKKGGGEVLCNLIGFGGQNTSILKLISNSSCSSVLYAPLSLHIHNLNCSPFSFVSVHFADQFKWLTFRNAWGVQDDGMRLSTSFSPNCERNIPGVLLLDGWNCSGQAIIVIVIILHSIGIRLFHLFVSEFKYWISVQRSVVKCKSEIVSDLSYRRPAPLHCAPLHFSHRP